MSPERYYFKNYSLRVLSLNSAPFRNYQFLNISDFEQLQSLKIWLRKKLCTRNFKRSFFNLSLACPRNLKSAAVLVFKL